jgi:hypothetical protein
MKLSGKVAGGNRQPQHRTRHRRRSLRAHTSPSTDEIRGKRRAGARGTRGRRSSDIHPGDARSSADVKALTDAAATRWGD